MQNKKYKNYAREKKSKGDNIQVAVDMTHTNTL